MTRIIALSLALTAGGAAVALASNDNAPVDPATADSITALLTDQGYQVAEIEMEGNGMFEVEATKDGKTWEIELDADLNIVETEADDD